MGDPGALSPIVRTARVPCAEANAIQSLCSQLGDEALELVLLFVSSSADFGRVVAEASRQLGSAQVVACTTAGEIFDGYCDDSIVAVGFCRTTFRAGVVAVPDVQDIDSAALIDRVVTTRNALTRGAPEWPHECYFLMIDGLSTREEVVASVLAVAVGGHPLVGGSAADGHRFLRALVAAGETVYEHGAVLCLFRTACPIRSFHTDHYAPTARRMVVTAAEPRRRRVSQINAEPAARVYARLLSLDVGDLSPAVFAQHPLVIRIGGRHHARAIRRATEDGSLVFFSAVDEGVVLTLAESRDAVGHLQRELSKLSESVRPDLILACEALWRRMEAEAAGVADAISRLLAAHRVVGFNTYGEQCDSMHVNQTLTGVAIYPPAQ